MRRLIAVSLGIVLVSGCLPFKDDGLYACDTDTGKDCVTCGAPDASGGTWCRDITAQVAGARWLNAIGAAAPDAIWAVGSDGVIVKWDGSHWSPEASGFQGGFNAVFAASATDVFVASNDAAWGYNDGAKWVVWTQGFEQEWPALSGTMYPMVNMWGVGGRPATITWMLGEGGQVYYFQFWDTSLNPDAYAVWHPEDLVDVNVQWKLYGIASTDACTPGTPGPVNMWGAYTNAAGTSYLVGNCGTVLEDAITNESLAMATRLTTNTSEHLQGIFNVPGTSNFWVVGASGTILYYDAGPLTFTSRPASTSETLWGICGTGANDIWVAGSNQTLLHWTITPPALTPAWVTVVQPFQETIFGLYCTGTDVWAVTDSGAILRYRR